MRALGCTTSEAGHLPILSSVGFQFERKALAYNHTHIMLSLSKEGTMQNINVRKGRHCVFMMHVHLVFVTKYRPARFSDQLGFLKDIFESVCKDFNAELVEMNGERDHGHLLVNYPPTVSASRAFRAECFESNRRLGSKEAWDPACGRLRIPPLAAVELPSR